MQEEAFMDSSLASVGLVMTDAVDGGWQRQK